MTSRKIKSISDHQLIDLINDGNALSLSKLFDRYWEDLLNTAFKVIGDKDIAQDVVQEVFISLWDKRGAISVKNVSAYLHQSTRYVVFGHLRKNKLSVRNCDVVEAYDLACSTTEQQLDFNELSRLIEQSINELPEQRQKVFRLSRYEHLTNKEIAVKLNISVRTVDGHIAKALKTLRYSLMRTVCIIGALLPF